MSKAENSVRSASDVPVLGSIISEFANRIANLNDYLKSLKGQALSFSRELSEQSSKLSKVTNYANKMSNELYSSWYSRKNAPMLVYITLCGLIVAIAFVFGFSVYKKGRHERIKTKKFEEIEHREFEKAQINLRDIIGALIAIIGVLLLIHSLVKVNEVFLQEAKKTWPKFFAFVFMFGISSYLTNKGVSLISRERIKVQHKREVRKEQRVIGGIFLVSGLFILILSYLRAENIINSDFSNTIDFADFFFTNILVFILMLAIGGYLTSKGVSLVDYPELCGLLTIPIGVVILILSFNTANNILSSEFDPEVYLILIKMLFIFFMVLIGSYLTGKGIQEILKI
ncbi:MAG: hypothetical protein QXT98_00425 [Archaeoglobaceae archaeon]